MFNQRILTSLEQSNLRLCLAFLQSVKTELQIKNHVLGILALVETWPKIGNHA